MEFLIEYQGDKQWFLNIKNNRENKEIDVPNGILSRNE